MEFKGHLTADATIRVVKTKNGDKSVVSFRVGENNNYKSNGVWITQSMFYNCSYWLNPEEAKQLKKGTGVMISGAMELRYYTDAEGKVVPVAEVKVGSISYVAKRPKRQEETAPVAEEAVAVGEDDLPF